MAAAQELAAAQAELQDVEYRMAAKQMELEATPLKDKNQRASVNLEIKALERSKTAAARKQKMATVKARKAEIEAGGGAVNVALPDDWQESLDPASGNPFYYNSKTGESSWTRPAAPEPAPATSSSAQPAAASSQAATQAGGLAEGWTEHVDPGSGKTFYYKVATGETSWTKPEAPQEQTPAESSAPASDWAEHVDPGTGNTFYYNAKTGETSWTNPEPAKSAAATATPAAAADEDWQESIDPASGNPFYYNPKTGETSWTKPAASQSSAGGA